MATTQTNNGAVAGPVKLTVDCELMVNNSPSKAVAATHPIQVAEDSTGNPMIFSVGLKPSAARTLAGGWLTITSSTRGWPT